MIEGVGRGQCFFRCVLHRTHWTQSGCPKETGVSLGQALNCVCGTGLTALAVSEEGVRTLFEDRSRQTEIVRSFVDCLLL